MNEGRFKGYDYAVMGLFVLVVIGVSLSWYRVSVTLGDQSLGAGASGWHYAWGALSFVAALVAVVVVSLKGPLGAGGSLPGWYKEGPLVMALGDLVALFAIIGFIDKPGGGVDVLGLVKIGYGAGIFLTLIAGLLMGGCGILALRDRSAAARTMPGAGAGPANGAWQSSSWQAGPLPPEEGPDAMASWYCQACGAQLDADSRFCRACGRPKG